MRVVSARSPLPTAWFVSASVLLITVLIAGCGGSIAVDLNTIAAVSAPAGTLRVNQTMQLNSKYLAAGLPMNFYVNGIEGGNA